MRLVEERKLVVEYGKQLIERGLATGTFGNVSVYNPEEDLMAISPSGMDYYKTEPEDIVVMRLDGTVVEGKAKPSSEYDLHRIFYQKRPDVRAVVHTHSKYATTISCMHKPIPPIHYVIGYAGKEIPCAPYAQFGTWELAESCYETMGDRNGVLLGNHGAVAVGGNISYAMDTAQQMEFVAEIYYNCLVAGSMQCIDDEKMEKVMGAFASYRKK